MICKEIGHTKKECVSRNVKKEKHSGVNVQPGRVPLRRTHSFRIPNTSLGGLSFRRGGVSGGTLGPGEVITLSDDSEEEEVQGIAKGGVNLHQSGN